MLRLSRWAIVAGVFAFDPVTVRDAGSPTSVSSSASTPAHAWLRAGTPDIKAAGTLAFTPDGLLLVGDSPGSAVFALDVRDNGPVVDTVNVKAIDDLVAARLGTKASEIAINDIAVHPKSHAVYLSVARGLGTGARPAIVRVGAKGRVDVVALANIPFAKAVLPNRPMPGMKDDDGDDASDRAITGMAVVGGSVYVTGISNDEFSSTLRRLSIPFTPSIASTGLRIYHTHHSRFETKSPVTALTSYSANGRDYLVVSYSCTPLAIFSVDSLTDGAKVTGKTIAELGAGTHATSIINYDFKGRRYLAVSTIGRSIQILEANDLAAAQGLGADSNPSRGNPLGSWFMWGLQSYSSSVPGVIRMADFDANNAVVLHRTVQRGVLSLRELEKPILWARGTAE
jgi:hypothetical protein